MAKISIEAKQGVFLTYKNYTYTAAQVFGEYIDNAIQSNENHKHQLRSMYPNHLLRVDISVDWYHDSKDKTVKAKSITIQDNAAGMTSDEFAHAFNLAEKNLNRKGMNEFGVGMKAASAWLGNTWRVETTSIDDNITRILDVNLTEVADNQIKELDSEEKEAEYNTHGTKITISDFWPENVIKKDTVDKLKKNIASIYRYFIRNEEIRIFFEDELLKFEDYEVLSAPSYKDPEGRNIIWKKSVSVNDKEGHEISGFVALLKDMSDEKRGVVFTRNNRVVLGFDPEDRTVGKVFMGQIGSRKYRRVFGELEISGFSVAFGKNKLNDLDLLEEMCKGVAGKLKIDDVSLLTQGDKYTKKHSATKPNKKEETRQTEPTENSDSNTGTVKEPITKTETNKKDKKEESNNTVTEEKNYSSSFNINGEIYSIEVDKIEGTEDNELFWNDLEQIDSKKLICKVNVNHPFFLIYKKDNNGIFELFEALSIAKFKTNMLGDGSANEMMNEFNIIIKNLN